MAFRGDTRAGSARRAALVIIEQTIINNGARELRFFIVPDAGHSTDKIAAVSNWIQIASDWLWGAPLLVIFLGVGVYLLLRLRFVQFRQFGVDLLARARLGSE